MTLANLEVTFDEGEHRIDVVIEEAGDEGLENIAEEGGKGFEPGIEQRPPAQYIWSHVDHAATRYLRGLNLC